MASNTGGSGPDVRTLLGEVKDAAGQSVTHETIFQQGKYVFLYFSAHWCPPCRGFTPKLVDFYNKFKDAKNFEIIFVSSDRDEASFNDYYKDMPWCTLPYDPEKKQPINKTQLSQTFSVSGIPTLLLFDGKSGQLITADGRTNVMEDTEAKEFPWLPMSLSELFKIGLLSDSTAQGTVPWDEATRGKVVGIYFSAHWCPPCRQFTPKLVETYKKLQEKKKNFEIVFVSKDRDEPAFTEYYSEMPWLALPFSAKKAAKSLAEKFNIQGIPMLIILDEDGDVITPNGRAAIMADSEGEKFPWIPEPLSALNDLTIGCVNDTPTLIYMTGKGDQQEVAKAKEILQPIAEKHTAEVKSCKKAKKNAKELAFLYEADESEELADSIREFLKIEDTDPKVVLMDIGNQRKYVDTTLTKEHLEELVDQFKNDQVEFSSLQ